VSKPRQSMTRRTYAANARKAHVLYVALLAAAHSAEYSQALYGPLSTLQPAINAMRVMVCRDCSVTGYFEKPGDPYTSWGCLHPTVPFYDVRTGAVRDGGEDG